jgi:hypothetical protein
MAGSDLDKASVPATNPSSFRLPISTPTRNQSLAVVNAADYTVSIHLGTGGGTCRGRNAFPHRLLALLGGDRGPER